MCPFLPLKNITWNQRFVKALGFVVLPGCNYSHRVVFSAIVFPCLWNTRSDWFVLDVCVRRLLTVDPAARLTVDDVLEHPWLAEAPDNTLLSPAILHDREALEEMQQAHSQFLTSMRLPDKQVKLKPVIGANNPILKRRKQ